MTLKIQAKRFPRVVGLVAILSTFGLAHQALAAKFGYLTYSVKNSEVTITRCDQSATGQVNIPAEIYGKPVKKLGDSSFSYCPEITGVSIPDGVTSIGSAAFSSSMKLKDLKLPSGLKSFGFRAFTHTNIREVEIPSGVKVISQEAFVGCYRLREVKIPNGVREIGERVFSSCSRLEAIEIPATVTKMSTASFLGSDLKSIAVAAGNSKFSSVDGILYDKGRTRLISCPSRKEGAVKVPAGVKRLDARSFYDCQFVTSIKLPKSLRSIEDRVFSGCYALPELTLPAGLTDIGHHAFAHTILERIVIPASVQRMGGYVFARCRMKEIYFLGDAPAQMGAGVFDRTPVSGNPPEGRTVYFYKGAEGFTEPTWMGCPSVAIDPATPATNRLFFLGP